MRRDSDRCWKLTERRCDHNREQLNQEFKKEEAVDFGKENMPIITKL